MQVNFSYSKCFKHMVIVFSSIFHYLEILWSSYMSVAIFYDNKTNKHEIDSNSFAKGKKYIMGFLWYTVFIQLLVKNEKDYYAFLTQKICLHSLFTI